MTSQDEPVPQLRRFVRKEQAKVGFGGSDMPDSTFYAMIAKGVIPKPVKLGGLRRSISLWDEQELIEAQQRLLDEREERVEQANKRPPEQIYADVKLAPAPAPAAPKPPPVEADPPPPSPPPPPRRARGGHAPETERNAQIGERWEEGWPKKRIAKEFGVSVERVRQILARLDADREVA
jgi:predicted DNA-binding transcriptional regulator AlpA